MSIQNLIDKSNQYKNTSWFNKDKFWSNLWSKLASAYSNLNYVMASNIIKAIEKGGDDLKLDTEVYAEGFAQLLVDKKVGVAALVSVMRKGNLSFSGKNFYKLLDTLHKGYVKAPGLFTEEIMARMEYVKALPFVGNNNLSDEEKEYIQNLETPLELVDMLIQKPENMTFVAYKDFIESSLTHIRYDNNAAESRKTEVILLGLKNLMNYENIYTDRVEVQQPADLNVLNIQDPADQIIEGKQSKIITEIEDWIGDEDDISKKTALANKLFHALKSADLIGTSYEKQVVDYVKTETNVSKQDKVMQYAIYEARKAAKTAIQTSAEALRTSLIGVAAQNQNLPKLKLDNFKKDGKDIAVKKLFEKAANSGRLQREVKRYVMKQLGEKKKLTDAATTISGHENVQKMAVMLASMDQETFTLIGAVMSQTMSEIQSEHNLNPEFWNGTMSRGWNKFTSYPAAAFFAVIDFFAIVFAYIGEYTARGACKAYEGVRALVGKPVTDKRENQDIFKKTDVEAAIDALVHSLQDVKVDTSKVKSSAKEELRDAILELLNNKNNDVNLKDKLNAVANADNSSSELKTAIGRIKNEKNLATDKNKKALQAILDMPEMNQNISNALPSWAKAAKGISILRSIG